MDHLYKNGMLGRELVPREVSWGAGMPPPLNDNWLRRFAMAIVLFFPILNVFVVGLRIYGRIAMKQFGVGMFAHLDFYWSLAHCSAILTDGMLQTMPLSLWPWYVDQTNGFSNTRSRLVDRLITIVLPTDPRLLVSRYSVRWEHVYVYVAHHCRRDDSNFLPGHSLTPVGQTS
jgi:hypothetical protein